MPALKHLEARHKAACRLRIEGKNNAYIATALNMSKRTLECWWCDDLVVDYLQTLAENIEREFAFQLATAGMTAVQELTRILSLDDAEEAVSFHTKLEIARDLMDRTPALAKNGDRRTSEPVVGHEGDTTNILALIGNMSNEDLAGFVNGGWNKGLNGTNGNDVV